MAIVEIGGSSIEIHNDPEPDGRQMARDWAKPIALRWSYHARPQAIDVTVSPEMYALAKRHAGAYWAAWRETIAFDLRRRQARKQARIRRMHTAYSRRRGRGRW